MPTSAPLTALPSIVDEDERVDDAIKFARSLLRRSLADETRSERQRKQRLGRMLADRSGRDLLFALTDEVLRIDDPTIAAQRYAAIVAAFPSKALGAVDQSLLRSGTVAGRLAPGIVMDLVTRRIKAETHGIVLAAEDPAFADHVTKRLAQGVRLNVNPLGEAILSDAEADARFEQVLSRLARSDVDYVSVKISAIVANLDALGFDHNLERVCERLAVLYRRAEAASPRTFINLDMEEYRDLELTMAAFMQVLSDPEFIGIDAGIVLQAYLPDSHDALDRLGTWAAQRRADGGGRVKIRLVKGANLAMETAEAELHNWVPAPYPNKALVDASYKRMLDTALQPAWADALRLGVASHNLFDVAWALLTARAADATERVEIEMLEGMAPAQARAVHDVAGDLLLYAPVVAEADYDASIAYLTRRLDENTQDDNFLKALFTLTPSVGFDTQAQRFALAVQTKDSVSTQRRRRPVEVTYSFANEPDTDFTDPWARAEIVDALPAPPLPTWVEQSTVKAIDELVASAADAAGDRYDRRNWLLAAAELMRTERAETIALMADEVSKTIGEGDPEVSEAIDFCRYYAEVGIAALAEAEQRGLSVEPRGTVAVIGPWNFPYAIPVGGVAASLAAGNSVILKPAPEAQRVGAWIADQFWRAGVPTDVLQLAICPEGDIGRRLITHPDVDMVVLTGGYATAQMFLEWDPHLRLYAETSGKDALVITAAADIDQAIADLVRSAFGHAGQKCSAASLGIIEASVYDNEAVMKRIADAVESLRIGDANDPATMMSSVVSPPGPDLERGLTQLEAGERWLVEPRCVGDDGRRWTPGVRIGVKPDSWFHRTECFGPVLGLMRADDLDHAIELQNASRYGLTGGIHSLADDEVQTWLRRVEVGNAYVNRHITGAIVQRQPFGGWKRSRVGGGAKAGGPNYLYQFAAIDDSEERTLAHVTDSYERAWDEVFSVAHDPTGLRCEANILRYVPLKRIIIRHDGGQDEQVARAQIAAMVTGVSVTVSDRREQPDGAFASARRPERFEQVRLLCAIDDDARRELHRRDVTVIDDPVVSDGRVELRHWMHEQAISRTMHRHGRLLDIEPLHGDNER